VLGVVLVTAVVTGYVNGYLAVAIAIVLLALPFPLATPDDPLPRGYRAAARMLAGMWVSPRRYPDFAWVFGTRFLVPRGGLAMAHRAAVSAEPDSRVIAGLAMLHVGEAYAMLGDEHACVEALGLAEDHFARIAPDDPAGVLFSPTQHGRLAGSCFLFLGKPEKAEPILDATREILKDQKKSTAIVLGNLALAGVRQRNVDTAVIRLHEAIDVVEQNRGGGGLNVVFTAARELRPWRNERAVQEVNDRLLGLMI